MIKKAFHLYEKYIPAFIVLALFLGILAAKYIPSVMGLADAIMSRVIDGIIYAAPLAIFVILAPSVARMITAGRESRFAGFVIVWFGLTRIAAGVWAGIFTVLILGLPLLPSNGAASVGIWGLVVQNLKLLLDLMTHSVFFMSIWISIIVGIVAYFRPRLHSVLQKAAQSIETAGGYIEPVIPVLMLVLGAYIYALPQTLSGAVSGDMISSLSQSSQGNISILGLKLNIATEFGLVWVYVIGSVMIGVGCFLWQAMQLAILKQYVAGFSIKKFFKEYWLRVYPLAWATSSEVISMPLNMSLIKRQFQNVDKMVRRLVVGLGAYLNINGTTMHVILLAGIVCVLVGYQPSLFQLVLAVPLIALIGYGVPGIPGELVIFAVPILKILSVPEPVIPGFMALYLTLQVGLPDSFRTGANVTDNGIYAVGLNKLHSTRFAKKKVRIREVATANN